MNRNVSISLLLALLACSAAAAQDHRSRGRNQDVHESNIYRDYTTIRLVQSASEHELPVPPPTVGVDDNNRIEGLAKEKLLRERARASQPYTLGQILKDDKDDEQSEMQFCEQVWQCAGGRDQGCLRRWRRDFRRNCQFWAGGITGGNGLAIPCLGLGRCGFGGCCRCGVGCGCRAGCGACGGCGCGDGCGSGLYTDPLPSGAPLGGDPALGRGRVANEDPYRMPLEDDDPYTEIVGRVHILEDKVIR